MAEKMELPQFVNQRKDVAVTEFESWKEVLSIELKNRKMKLLHQYLEKLNKQEEKLLLEYDKHAQRYKERLQIVCKQHNLDHCASENTLVDPISVKDCVNAVKKQGKPKYNNTNSKKYDSFMFPEIRIQLSNADNNKSNSLGELNTSMKELKIDSDGDKIDSMVYSQWTHTNKKDVYMDFIKDLQQFPGLKEEITEFKGEPSESKLAHLNKKAEKRRLKNSRRKNRKEKGITVEPRKSAPGKKYGQKKGKENAKTQAIRNEIKNLRMDPFISPLVLETLNELERRCKSVPPKNLSSVPEKSSAIKTKGLSDSTKDTNSNKKPSTKENSLFTKVTGNYDNDDDDDADEYDNYYDDDTVEETLCHDYLDDLNDELYDYDDGSKDFFDDLENEYM